MILNKTDSPHFFTFPKLSECPHIWHGIFTRHGGYSQKPYQSLNIANGLGDPPGIVKKNRNAVARCAGSADIIYIHQNHGAEILSFGKEDPSGTPFANPTVRVGDAMITDIPGKFLSVQVADCQSILMVDVKQRVVANVHAGWRGSIKNIVGRTVRIMKKRFGCDPLHILAGIGPSLGPCCAEFRNYEEEIPESFWKYKNASNYFDFWAVSTDQLSAEGLLREHISISGLCSKCRTDLFFSYRGEGITGRFASIIGLIH